MNYYSFSEKGFFITSVHGTDIPEDAVPITWEEHNYLLAGQGGGKVIEKGEDGRPILVDAPPTPKIVPQIVSRFQALAALHIAGLLPTIEAAMESPDADPLQKLAWKEAREFNRNSPTILAMSNQLNLTDEQVDDLFTLAATLEA